MADTAKSPAPQPSPTRRQPSPPGIENPHPVASTSAKTLDVLPAASSSSVSTNPAEFNQLITHAAGSEPTQLGDNPAIVDSDSISASLQAATAGLNEEDAKLLASLAEGNGLLSHLSNLAAQNGSSTDLINAYAGGLNLDPSSAINFSTDSAGLNAAQQAFRGAVDLNEALTHQDMLWDDDAFDDLEPEDEDGEDQGPIQAYAKLEFPGFSYYIQTLDVTIGRRPGQLQPNQRPGAQPPQLPNAASGLSQAHITSESKTEGDVDVDLGPLKSISRLHARIFYYTGPIHPPNTAFLNGTPAHSRASSATSAHQNVAPYRITSPASLNRVNGAHLAGTDPASASDLYQASLGAEPEHGDGQFVLMVVGRNGAFVDDVWVEKGGLVVLGKRTKIQIAERVFYFVLPPPPGEAAHSDDGDSQRAHDSESDSLSDLSSEEGSDDQDEDDQEDDEEADSSSSVSSQEGEDDDYDGEDAATANKTGGRRKSSASKAEADKPKRRLVLKPKSRVGKPSAVANSADESGADEPMDEEPDAQDAGKKGQGKAQAKGKPAAKTTAAALANRAAGKGKGKGKGFTRGKMPTKGPLPDSRPGGDDSDSLGTPSAGEEHSADEDQDDGITTPPPPATAKAGTAAKRPGKSVKGLKGAQKAKAARGSKATAAPDHGEASEDDAAADAPDGAIKKESPTPAWAMGAGVAGRKRKRGDAVADEEPALKVGTPIGIEALDAAKRAKAAKARADASSRASASPKKDATAVASAVADDDDVVMVDVKPAQSKALAAATPAAAAADTAPSATAASKASAAIKPTPAKAAATTANKSVSKTAEATTPASKAGAKAKPAKPKATKPKKKKGTAADETSATSEAPDQPANKTPGVGPGAASMPVGAFPGAYGAPGMHPSSMPYDPSSANAASTIIAAANAVSGSMPNFGQPQAAVLPHAVGQMASPLPMIPSAVAGRNGGVSGTFSSLPTPGPASAQSTAAPNSGTSSNNASASDASTWPTTASIIASAASLANAAKQKQTPASNTAAAAAGTNAGNKTGGAAAAPAPATPKPPPGPEDKPGLSNIELISQALRSDHCAKKGGKLTLQEVYEWIANRWIWFKRNGRHTGRDWQSSIRHAIGSSRDFTRIPRRSDEPGKGIFYTMSDSKLAEEHRANLAKQKEEAAKAAAAAPAAPANAGPAGSLLSGGASTPGADSQAASGGNAAATAVAGAAAGAAAGSLPAIRIPLIIGTPPSSATAAAADKPKAAPGTIESLLETPPIVHHDGKLYLSPQVFGHLNAGQLAQIEGLGAQQALQVLQAYLVTHLKERMRVQQAAAQKKDAGAAAAKPASTPAKPSPVPTASAKASSTATSAAAKTATAAQGASGAQAGSANGLASGLKPASSAAAGPSTVAATASLPRPPVAGTPLLPKPVLPSPIKPSIPTSAQSSAAAAGAKGVPSASAAAASSPAPTAKASMTPALGSKEAAKSGSAVATTAAAGATAKTPVLPSTPLRTSAAGAGGVPKPSTPAPAPATKAATPGPATPQSATTAAKPASSVSASASTSGTPNAAAAGTSATGGEGDDPLSALSALAAHPEAAALIALLRKQQEGGASGGKQMAKLTPGQLQLLQMANKLAAQQGKKKKKKAAAGAAGSREATATPGPSGPESSPAVGGPSPSPGPKAG
ncbi:uncharacterized protein PAN0_020d5960 [Moesziomyces antarcticus]|uniref:Uncharacterized protein n=2 Tax=Pseudozyma antarctica TaxID=84753 RepID=A0A081CM35_PSEA2|nr:uncharacterized protein PAN0_020d5960 [Moesziomyces antarcticus]GAK67731.1 conserved hypothetical protein [Moesziomyces antarcticus]SPO49037.1 uncharacterized protein PSANT_06728 [Moesziomyces antarcticus]